MAPKCWRSQGIEGEQPALKQHGSWSIHESAMHLAFELERDGVFTGLKELVEILNIYKYCQAREHKQSRVHAKILSVSCYSSCLFRARYLVSRKGYDLNDIREYTNSNLKCECNNRWSNRTPRTRPHSGGDENVGLNGRDRERMPAPEERIPDPDLEEPQSIGDRDIGGKRKAIVPSGHNRSLGSLQRPHR